MTVKLFGNNGIAGLRIKIGYDENAFELIQESVKRGSAFNSLQFLDPIYRNDSFITSWFGWTNDLTDGTLLTFCLKAKPNIEEGYYPITISYDENNTIDETGYQLFISAIDGCIIVQ